MLATINTLWRKGGVISYPLATVAIYLLLKYIQPYLPAPTPDNTTTIFHIQIWVSALVNYTESHPYRLIIGSLGVGIFIHLYESFHNREKLIHDKECLISRKELLIASFGANFFSERSTKEQKQEDWNYFLAKILEENPSQLKILGASGYETFHVMNSPLHKLIEAFPYSVQILLLDSNSQYVPERAQSVGEKTTKYRSDIADSVKWLKGLSQRNTKVEVKTYDHLPNWKMILTDKHLWLQYYMPNKHVDDSVVYIIYRNNNIVKCGTVYTQGERTFH